MPEELDRQSIVDNEHLKLLSWGYMVSGAFAAVFSLFALIYVVIGVAMTVAFSNAPPTPGKPGDMPPEFIGYIFGGIGLALFLLMVTVATLKFLAARYLSRRRGRTYCMIIAALTCLEFPYGTFLGVCTFVVLARESVVRQFMPRAG